MATLISTPIPVATPVSTTQTPFLVCEYSDALVVDLALRPDLVPNPGPFVPEVSDGRAVLTLHAYSLQSVRTCIESKISPWRNSPLLGQRFVELSLNASFQQIHGRVLLHRWTSARLQSLIAPRPFGLTTTEAQIDLVHTPSGVGLRLGDRINPTREFSAQFAPTVGSGEAIRGLSRLDAFTIEGATARRFTYEFTGVAVTPAQGVITSTAFLDPLFSLVSTPLEILGAALIPHAYSARISLPVCINGEACTRAWNE